MSLSKAEISGRWPDVVAEFGDLTAAYEAMSDNVEAHEVGSANYYRWIAAALAPYLGRRTLELGAGPGLLTRWMPGFDFYMATEVWGPYVDKLRSLAAARTDLQVETLDADLLAAEAPRLRALEFDSVFSSNLLEHLKDDVAALATMGGLVRPGGRIVHFVPALRSLYGPADSTIGHYRRYERAELVAKIEAAGLAVERVFWFNMPGVLAWVLVNKILRQRNTGGGQFKAFNAMVPLFRAVEAIMPAPVGASLVAVARRKGG